MSPRVALVSRDPRVRARLLGLVAGEGVSPVAVDSIEGLIAQSGVEGFDLVVVDSNGEHDVPIAPALAALEPCPALVVLSGGADPTSETGLKEAGADAVLSAHLDDRDLVTSLRALLGQLRRTRLVEPSLARESEETAASDGGPGVESPLMQELLRVADRVAASDAAILILGETGSGKEWLARRIHAASGRASGPFVAVNCAAIPEGLAESELFGHVEGAFTGAVRTRRGHLQRADGGTLFLDEVGDLSPSTQVRLLRALEDKSFQPVGGEEEIRSDFRVIAATNRLREEELVGSTLRDDLYFRLSVVSLTVPPLRDRSEDVSGLVEVYLERLSARSEPPVEGFSSGAMEALTRYPWPGNVRELVNVVERAVVLADQPILTIDDLPPAVRAPTVVEAPGRPSTANDEGRPPGITPFHEARDAELQVFERRYLTRLLEVAGGRVGKAASLAQMSKRALFNKMRRYDLRKEDFKD